MLKRHEDGAIGARAVWLALPKSAPCRRASKTNKPGEQNSRIVMPISDYFVKMMNFTAHNKFCAKEKQSFIAQTRFPVMAGCNF